MTHPLIACLTYSTIVVLLPSILVIAQIDASTIVPPMPTNAYLIFFASEEPKKALLLPVQRRVWLRICARQMPSVYQWLRQMLSFFQPLLIALDLALGQTPHPFLAAPVLQIRLEGCADFCFLILLLLAFHM